VDLAFPAYVKQVVRARRSGFVLSAAAFQIKDLRAGAVQRRCARNDWGGAEVSCVVLLRRLVSARPLSEGRNDFRRSNLTAPPGGPTPCRLYQRVRGGEDVRLERGDLSRPRERTA